MQTTAPKDTTAYFFCRYDEEESLKAKTIFGSIARQLANTLPNEAFRDFNYKDANPKTITEFLEKKLDHSRRYFVILDGLDESEKGQIKDVADMLYVVLNSRLLRVKLYFSSRPNIAGWPLLKSLSKLHINLETAVNLERVAADIRHFISTRLEEQLEGETPDLQVSDPTLILTIMDRLESKAQGM